MLYLWVWLDVWLSKCGRIANEYNTFDFQASRRYNNVVAPRKLVEQKRWGGDDYERTSKDEDAWAIVYMYVGWLVLGFGILSKLTHFSKTIFSIFIISIFFFCLFEKIFCSINIIIGILYSFYKRIKTDKSRILE